MLKFRFQIQFLGKILKSESVKHIFGSVFWVRIFLLFQNVAIIVVALSFVISKNEIPYSKKNLRNEQNGKCELIPNLENNISPFVKIF